MTCSHCGAEINENDKFCAECGVEITVVPPPEKASAEVQALPPAPVPTVTQTVPSPDKRFPVEPVVMIIVIYFILKSFVLLEEELYIVISFASAIVCAVFVGFYIRIRKVELPQSVFHNLGVLFASALSTKVASDFVFFIFKENQQYLSEYIWQYFLPGVLESIVIAALIIWIARLEKNRLKGA